MRSHDKEEDGEEGRRKKALLDPLLPDIQRIKLGQNLRRGEIGEGGERGGGAREKRASPNQPRSKSRKTLG